MATTATLKAYSGAYPSISNDIRASVAYASMPLALVAQIVESGTHNQRTWSFDGLPRNNYRFYLDEIDGDGNVVKNLADFDVVPGIISGSLSRDDEQIQVDGTPGLTAGETSWTLDGTDGKKDFRGWDIVVDECTGRDILVLGVDYSWDKTLGKFQLLLDGDKLQHDQWYNIHFNSQDNVQGNSYPTLSDFGTRLITETGNILATDFGNNILVEPDGDYIELTLPDINTVVPGRPLHVEIGNTDSDCSVKFLPFGSNTINFLSDSLYACKNESFKIYSFSRSGVLEWRVFDLYGNFKTVGTVIGSDNISVENAIGFDGSQVSMYKYARLYNEFVLHLPIAQIVNYSDHENSVETKCLYSYANPEGMFYLPDRRNFFERNSTIGSVAGTYHDDTIKLHKHKETIGQLPSPPFGEDDVTQSGNGEYGGHGTNKPDYTSDPIDNDGVGIGADETQPKNYRINKFVLV
jgi:hypothetical protein